MHHGLKHVRYSMDLRVYLIIAEWMHRAFGGGIGGEVLMTRPCALSFRGVVDF